MVLKLVFVSFVALLLPVAFSNNATIDKRGAPETIPNFPPIYTLHNRLAQVLALLEEYFYNSLSQDRHLFKNVPSCHSQVSKYLADYERDQNYDDFAIGEQKAQDLVQNPFLTFRQIRRIYQTLLHDVAKACEGHAKVKDNVEQLFTTYEIPVVIDKDLEGALRGILRFHYIYGFNATRDLRKGIIGGVDTGVLLNVEDCAMLAKAALDIYDAQVMAYQWLMAAEEIQKEEKFNDEDTRSKLAAVWTRLKQLTELSTKREIKQKYNGKIQESLKGKEGFDDYEYYATCRGESFLTKEELSQRFCYYESNFHPYLLLNPAKIEYLSFDPIILQIHDIVNPSAKAYIDKHLTETMMPAMVVSGNNGQSEISPLRTCMVSEIENPKEQPEMDRMFLKEETLTGLITRKNSAGQFTAAFYNCFGHHSYHYDILQGSHPNLEATGDRLVTMQYYLTDVELGGKTAFPEVGVWATPVANSALFWFNLKENGHPDKRMIHGGCPVLLGTKMIATKWIHQNDNIFKQPCPLHAAPEMQ